jgi:hypothetical protein
MQELITNGDNTIHLVASSKGGVGKSFVCWNFAEYLYDKGTEFYAADTDPSTPTFLNYAAFNVEHINIADSNLRINRIKFDTLHEDICKNPRPCVIDSGSSTFLSLMDYLKSEKIVENFQAEGRQVVIHTPLVGGQSFDHTVRSLQSILQFTQARVVVWENEVSGPISRDGVRFVDSTLFKQYANRILGVVKIQERDTDTYGPLVQNMTSQHLTYRQMLERSDIMTIAKQRIKNMRKDIFDQLEGIGL